MSIIYRLVTVELLDTTSTAMTGRDLLGFVYYRMKQSGTKYISIESWRVDLSNYTTGKLPSVLSRIDDRQTSYRLRIVSTKGVDKPYTQRTTGAVLVEYKGTAVSLTLYPSERVESLRQKHMATVPL